MKILAQESLVDLIICRSTSYLLWNGFIHFSWLWDTPHIVVHM